MSLSKKKKTQSDESPYSLDLANVQIKFLSNTSILLLNNQNKYSCLEFHEFPINAS